MKCFLTRVFQKKSLGIILVFVICFLVFAFWQSPKPSHYELTKQEKEVLTDFFDVFLLYEEGIYTLAGTKPVSISPLDRDFSQEKLEKWKEKYTTASKKKKQKLKPLNSYSTYTSNYREWEKIKQRLPIHQYLFGTFKLNSKYDVLVFVNIENTIKVLIRHYEIFHRTLGYDFDPLKIVFEVQNEKSQFWNDIMTHKYGHTLLGILLGFGVDNSYFFNWDTQYRESSSPIGEFIRGLPTGFYEKNILKPNYKKFNLPLFRSYGLHPTDKKLIKHYEKERLRIKKLYKGKDAVEVTLNWLTR
jgi:hypothetical protein